MRRRRRARAHQEADVTWNETRVNGTAASGYARGAYDGEPHAEQAAAPLPATVLEGDGPSAYFLETGPGSAYGDQALTLLDELDPGDRAFLQARGLITTPAAAPATTAFRIRLRARVVWPRNIAGARPGGVPIVFILMGNHAAFDRTQAAAPEIDNFTGYDYLQQALGELGIASCSVDSNFANELGLHTRARAEMLLASIELVRDRAAHRARVDFQNVGLVGHSRGGEAVVLAAMLAGARGLRVRAVASIAPTDRSSRYSSGTVAGQVSMPLSLAGVRFLVLIGSHDGDVIGPGRNGFGLYDRARCDKTLVFARGLTHNRFNSVWRECADYGDRRHLFISDDDNTCRTRQQGGAFDQAIFSSNTHREYAKIFVLALMRRALLADASAEAALRGLHAPTRAQLGATHSGPAASVMWSVQGARVLDEFDAPGIGARTVLGPGGAVQPANQGRPSVPHATPSFVASAVGHGVRIDLGGQDFSARRELCFRLTSMTPIASEAAIARAAAPDWELRLVTSRGTSTCRPAQLDRRGLRDPNRPFFHRVHELPGDGDPATSAPPINVTKNQFDTLVLPLSAFRDAELRDVRALEFVARGGELPLIVDSFAFV
jgi:hypothetical protein